MRPINECHAGASSSLGALTTVVALRGTVAVGVGSPPPPARVVGALRRVVVSRVAGGRGVAALH